MAWVTKITTSASWNAALVSGAERAEKARSSSLSGFFKSPPYKLAPCEPAALELDAVQDDILVGEFLVTDQHCSPRGNTPSLRPDESVSVIS